MVLVEEEVGLMRRRCGEGGWTTSVGGLQEVWSSASDVGDEEGVPTLPNPAVDAVVSAGLGRSNRLDRGDESGVLNASYAPPKGNPGNAPLLALPVVGGLEPKCERMGVTGALWLKCC